MTTLRTLTVGLVSTLILPINGEGQDLRIPDSLPPGVTPAMIQRGKLVFEGPGLCFNCHGPDAHGSLGPNLTDSDWWHAKGAYLEIVRQILMGVSASESVSGAIMPPRGGSGISEAEVQAVAAYIWSRSHPEAGDSLPDGVTRGMVREGMAVFRGKGGCVQCHGPDARGGVGPNLTDRVWLHAKGSFLAIMERVLSGVTSEESATGTIMPPRGGSAITDADVMAVAAYVWAISRHQTEGASSDTPQRRPPH